MKGPHPSGKWFLWAIGLLMLGIVAGIFLVGNGDSGGREKNTQRFGAGEAVSRTADPGSGSSVVKTSLKRGRHQTLVYPRPQEVERNVDPRKLFAGDLFTLRDGPVRGPLSLNRYTRSAVEARYDPDALAAFLASDAGQIELPLTAEKTVAVEVKQVLTRGEETYSVKGQVKDELESDVLLVFHDGSVSGSVAFYNRNTHYQFGMAGNGDVVIRELDPSAFTETCGLVDEDHGEHCDHDHAHDHAEQEERDPVAPGVPSTAGGQSSAEEADSTIIMDIVVGYGQQARQAEGSVAAMEAHIIEAVDRTNSAFGNSQISGIELVLLGTVEDPDYVFPGDIADEMGSSDELGDLKNTSDGALDTVTDLRTALGADTAAFVIKDIDGSAGIAERPGNDMIVARSYMSTTRLTFVHEFGHNIGCRHAWGDSDGIGNYSNRGWRFQTSSGTKYRTVMAYDWSWTRVPYFSDPDIDYPAVNGAPTGAVDGYDATNDPLTDPRLVSGGEDGDFGIGFDGSNPGLGARNADYIQSNAQFVADNDDRPAPEITVETSTGESLTDGTSTLDALSPLVGLTSTQTVTIRNDGELDLTGLAVTKDGANAGDFTIGALGATTLTPGASTTFTVGFTPSSSATRTAALHISSNDADENPFDITLSGSLGILNGEESFETGFGIWTQGSGDDMNWSRDSAGTGSSGTGPSTGSDGSFYLYTEASTPNYPSKRADLEATFDFTGYTATLLFDYHMYGASMGSLSVDVYDGTWHNDVWTISGQQHDSNGAAWTEAQVSLVDYANKSGVIVRFRGITGSSFQSDMAIDNIRFTAAPPPYTLTYTAGAGGSINGTSPQTVESGGDGSPVQALADSGFHFVDWSDSSTANPRTDTSVGADISVVANFDPDTFAQWAASVGLSGADAQPDSEPFGDGLENQIKFAFGLDGDDADVRPLVPEVGTSGLPVVYVDDTGPSPVLCFEYVRRKVGGVIYTAEQSTDLGSSSWVSLSGTATTEDIDDLWERVTIEYPLSSAPDGLFFKIEVTLP